MFFFFWFCAFVDVASKRAEQLHRFFFLVVSRTVSIFLVNCMNFGMSKHAAADWTWRFPVGIQLVWASILFLGFLASPESPRFLASKERWDDSRKSLARLRGLSVDDPELEMEMEEIKIAKAEDDARGAVKYSECFSMKDMILYRTMVGITVQIGQQVTGINFFFVSSRFSENVCGISRLATDPHVRCAFCSSFFQSFGSIFAGKFYIRNH